MLGKELEELRSLLYSLDTKYYDEENEKLEKEIKNIELGKPRNEHNSQVVPPSQVKKEIKKLQNQIIANNKAKEDLKHLIGQIRSYLLKLDTLVEEEVLFDSLRGYVERLSYGYSEIINKEKIKRTDALRNNLEAYRKLYFKSTGLYVSGLYIDMYRDKKRKVVKQLYKTLEEANRFKAYKVHYGNSSIYLSIGQEMKNRGMSIDKIHGIRFNGTRLNSISDILYQALEFYHGHNLQELHVKVDSINQALQKMEGEPNYHSLTYGCEDCLKKLKLIRAFQKKCYNVKGMHKTLTELENKYNEIVELSRETWYLEEILKAFEDTYINESKMYKGLKEIVVAQEKELSKLISKADKLYEQSGLKNEINLELRLQTLYQQIKDVEYKIEQKEKEGNYFAVSGLKNEIDKLRTEMIMILSDNPELYRPEYDINVKNVANVDKIEEENTRKINHSKNSVSEKQDAISENLTKTQSEKEVSAKKSVIEEPNVIDNHSVETQTKEETSIEKNNTKETDEVERFKLASDLQIIRTSHYQDYMTEKVKKTELGDLLFSEYLESVVSNLKELIKEEKQNERAEYLESVVSNLKKLIEVERQREKMAETIYKEYIKYYAALETKKDAMSFEEYAQANYRIGNIDVPVKFEEEYEEIRKR